jgi:hypothetical protein
MVRLQSIQYLLYFLMQQYLSKNHTKINIYIFDQQLNRNND